MKHYFVTGIGTGVGKTIVSAILTEALEADYWKPIQSGDLDDSDTLKVQKLVSNPSSIFHEEAYRLKNPLSPHESAKLDNITITLDKITAPVTTKNLVIEGAGGLMVPLNETDLMIDLIKKLNVEVILVSRHYLGSINHTLLSAFALKQYQIPVKGIIFNGGENAATETAILKETGFTFLGRINEEPELNKTIVSHYAAHFSKILL